MAQLLSESEIQSRAAQLTGWIVEDQALKQTCRFQNFIEAIAFVNRLVEPAETVNHHPDIAISYNQVELTLTTHSAGGLTEKDFDLAKTISQLI